MKIKVYMIGFHISILLLAIFVIVQIQSLDYHTVDIASLNDRAESIRENLQQESTKFDYVTSDHIHILEQQYNCKIVSLKDSEYMSKLYHAYDDGAAIFDYMEGETLRGKIIFPRNDDTFQRAKSLLLKIVLGVMGITLLLTDAFAMIGYVRIIMPFKRLKKFAMNVSAGNLDIPLTMEKQNYFGAFTESFDVMREELKAAREGEARANQSKKELVASLSHDIKTPVATIKALCELLELSVSEEENCNKIRIIHKKAEVINELISNMFHATLAELEALKIDAKPEPSTILMEMCEEMNHYELIHYKNQVPSCLILCDPLRMTQVLDNIISNSYKYANTRIDISFWETQSNVFLKIKDYGKELEDLDFALICEKFYRGSNANDKAGSGLGLFLAKQFMEGMKGSLLCENDGGFAVTLSLEKVGK